MSNLELSSDTEEIEESDFRKLHEKATKVGYGDGVAAGEEHVFQSSFDMGYSDGLRTGLELEKFRAFYSRIASSNTKAGDELLEEAKIYESMNILETTNRDHFQYNQHIEEPLSDITTHQNKYLNKHLKNFKEKLPQTNNLFSLKN